MKPEVDVLTKQGTSSLFFVGSFPCICSTRQVNTAHERESKLFWLFIYEIQAFKMSTPTGMSLNLQQRVDGINRHKKGDTAIAIAGAFSGKAEYLLPTHLPPSAIRRVYIRREPKRPFAARLFRY